MANDRDEVATVDVNGELSPGPNDRWTGGSDMWWHTKVRVSDGRIMTRGQLSMEREMRTGHYPLNYLF